MSDTIKSVDDLSSAQDGDSRAEFETVIELRDRLHRSQLETAYWRGRAEALDSRGGKQGPSLTQLGDVLAKLRAAPRPDGG
jgi:hypothetical protein